jgi:hypothetical protein
MLIPLDSPPDTPVGPRPVKVLIDFQAPFGLMAGDQLDLCIRSTP